MLKSKIISKAGATQLVVSSMNGQQLSEREIYAINNRQVKGMLFLNVVPRGAAFDLVYNLTGLLPLPTFLQTPQNKASFARILGDIVTTYKSLGNAYFNQKSIMLEIDRVMVNPASQSVYFAYIPIQGYECAVSLRDFFGNMIRYLTFSPGEDTGYVREFIGIVNGGINFSIFALEEYVKKLTWQPPVKKEPECPRCHAKVAEGANFCPACGAKITTAVPNVSVAPNVPVPPNVPVAPNVPTAPNVPARAVPPVVPAAPGTPGPQSMKGIYDPLGGSAGYMDRTPADRQPVGIDGGTVMLGVNQPAPAAVRQERPERIPVSRPYLIRERTNEKIPINKTSFRIGKKPDFCNYVVTDNKTVSRNHAEVITRGGRYFIMDLESTNGTYVNGQKINPKTEVEIFPGTKIRLSSESFVFGVE